MRRFKRLFLIGLIVWLAMGSGFVAAGEQKMACKDRFSALDTNGDGKVTMEEFKAFKHPGIEPEQMFATIDKNRDQVITVEEYCLFSDYGHGKGKAKM